MTIVRVSAKSGKNQGDGSCLANNIREKSGNLTNARDNQGNIRETVYLPLQSIEVLIC